MRKLLLLSTLVVTLVLSVFAATAQAVTTPTGWVCQYLNHPAPVPYAQGYLYCFSDYRWWYVHP